MDTFEEYQRAYHATRARLEAEYHRLPLPEKSRRVLGRDNPLLYSSRAVTAKLSRTGLSALAIAREMERQLLQFERIAYHTLVCVPLRRIALPDARWIFLDFSGQAGAWRYRRAEAVSRFCAAIARRPPEATCRFLSGGIVTSDLLDRLLLEEFSRPRAALRVTAQQIHCRFRLWVARSRRDIPSGTCIQIV
ncbi:MAG: hypothetical protein NZ578_07695, partial [Candidatus Binatia bacterium]|nr:hypothetical protein [Candidatus Binatia bacterium]